MKVCFLAREYPPETHIGGIGTYTFNVASALSKLGHTIHVITSTREYERTYKENGIWVHRVKSRRVIPKELSHLEYSRIVAKKISKINIRFDIVQSSEFASEAFWFSLKKKVPLITRLATPYYLAEELDNKAFLGPRRPSIFLNFMEKRQTFCSDGIFASTKALANSVTKKWKIDPSRVEIIPNSVDLSHIIKLGKNNPEFEILQERDFILYFGRLEERKGVRILANALPTVLKRFPSLNMVFIGSDFGYRGSSMRDYIKKAAYKYLNQLVFIDNLPHKKLFPIVNLAKLVVLPSLWEAFGFVCVEAMALGRPVIASAGSGFEEIIEDNISGYLVEPGDNGLLAHKIITSLEDEEKLRQISEGARKRAQSFEVSKVALKLLEYYKRIKTQWLKTENN